jgi:hypothetical protein
MTNTKQRSISRKVGLGEGLVRTISIAGPYTMGPQERCIFAVFFFPYPLCL